MATALVGTPAADDLSGVAVEAAADEIVVDEPIITPVAAARVAEPEASEAAAAAAEPADTAATETEPAPAAAETAPEPAAAQPATPPAEEVRDVLAPGGDIQEVVGSAPFQEALETIMGGKPGAAPDLEKWAHLIPEPDNPWDRNAVAVYITGRKIGYLARETSAAYAAILSQLWAGSRGRAVCRAVISGGWLQVQSQVGSVTAVPEEQFGVRLALAAPERFDASQGLRQLTDEELKEGPPPA